MKLYKFEKYYLQLARYKILMFIKEVLNNDTASTIIMIVGTLVIFMIMFFLFVYSLIGVNVFLEKVHLEKYRIEKIPLGDQGFDLKPYFKK